MQVWTHLSNPLFTYFDNIDTPITVAAGLKCTLANSAYTPKELAFQYTDSGAKLLFTSEAGLPVVLEMFELLGVRKDIAHKRIIVMGNGLEWAGGPSAPRPPQPAGSLRMEDLLVRGMLSQEEKFDGKDCHETVYMCYSSGAVTLQTLIFYHG